MSLFNLKKSLPWGTLNFRVLCTFFMLLYWASIGCNNMSHTTFTSNANLLTQKKENYSDSIYTLTLLRKGDSLLENISKKEIKIYVLTSQRLLKVINLKWPKVDSIETTFNLIEENRKPFVYIEVPYSESGDWNNTYTYYFDTIGNTRVVKIVSSFFNSECVEGVLTEETIFLYDMNFNKISTMYKIYDEKGNAIKDTSKCVFNYRFEFPLYKNYLSSLLYNKL